MSRIVDQTASSIGENAVKLEPIGKLNSIFSIQAV
jgi:hypothetical protein